MKQIFVFAFDEGARETRYGIRANSEEEAREYLQEIRFLTDTEAEERIRYQLDIECFIDITD